MTKRINGRAKGHNFERKLAKLFSNWSGVELKRTLMSGGWAKTGDITPVKPDDMVNWKLNIEAKCYARDTFHLEDLLKKSEGGPIMKWWGQCSQDAKTSNRHPLLIFTQNRDDVYVMMRREDLSPEIDLKYVFFSEYNLVVCLLDDFFKVFAIDYFINF